MRVRLTTLALALSLATAMLPLIGSSGVAVGQTTAPLFAESFEVAGLVAQPRRFTRDDLAAMSVWTMPVVFVAGQQVQSSTFSGPPLLDVIQAAGGPVLDVSRNNDRLRKFVVAVGADGYAVVLAWGEIDPEYGAEPVVVAFDRDGQPLGDGEGMARLVVPGDKRGGRPPHDPARIKGETDALVALKKIADGKTPFVSRGDNSGTQQLELSLRQRVSIDPKGQPWYIESGTGMGQTLTIADQRQAYTISDRATWLAFTSKVQLPIMVERDPVLLNVYHVMPVNSAEFPNVPINAAGGKAFVDFLVAPDTQKFIGEFGKDKYGQALFVPDAGKSEAEVGL